MPLVRFTATLLSRQAKPAAARDQSRSACADPGQLGSVTNWCLDGVGGATAGALPGIIEARPGLPEPVATIPSLVDQVQGGCFATSHGGDWGMDVTLAVERLSAAIAGAWLQGQVT